MSCGSCTRLAHFCTTIGLLRGLLRSYETSALPFLRTVALEPYGQYVWSIRPIWSPLSTCPVTMAPLHAADFVTMQVLAISMASLLYSVAQSRHGIAHCLRACGRWLWQLRHTSRAVVCGYVAATVGMDVMLELQAAELGLTPDYWHAYLPSQTCLHYCSAADSFSIDQTQQTVFTTKTIQTVMWP